MTWWCIHKKGISIKRISLNPKFWTNELLPKLTMFYDNCLGPEIVCPVHVHGLPVRNIFVSFIIIHIIIHIIIFFSDNNNVYFL